MGPLDCDRELLQECCRHFDIDLLLLLPSRSPFRFLNDDMFQQGLCVFNYQILDSTLRPEPRECRH